MILGRTVHLASLFNFCLCLPSGEWGPIKGEKGEILDIRLHRVYGIITEGDAEGACVGNWGYERERGRGRWEPRRETQKESGEGERREEGGPVSHNSARARPRPPAEGRDGNHELGIRGRRERSSGGLRGGMAGEGMTILGARRTCEFGTLVK